MDGRNCILQYVESLARPDGGYGWDDQPDSYLTPTFTSVGVYHLLGETPPHRQDLVAYIRAAHPIRSKQTETRKHTGDPRLFIYQQIQSLLWLNDDVSDYIDEIGSYTQPQEYPRMYEIRERPILREQAFALICRRLLHIPLDDAHGIVSYFSIRERENGSFNNTPAADGSDGHILNTWWSLMALQDLQNESANRAKPFPNPSLRLWVQQCQMPNGGFSYQPADGPGRVDDALYTLAAVWLLNHLGAAPIDRSDCVSYLVSLFNPDGGCGNRLGEPSCPMATLFAASALSILGELDALAVVSAQAPLHAARLPQQVVQTPLHTARVSQQAVHLRARALQPASLDNLQVFSVQLQAPGVGSPVEAVALAKALKIDLWGAKNSKPEWIAHAQHLADSCNTPVTFFQSNEEHRHYVGLPGLGYYTHVNDPIAPVTADMGASLEGQTQTWDEFRQTKLAQLEKCDGRMLWQICDNEESARILLDDSLERGGYAAISTFHFGCRNMAYTLPFVFRYRHLLPFISLQDAHGIESWWWADHLVGFRTMFLGTEPTWKAWTQALEKQWVVAVRHDAETYYRTRYLGGVPGVQEYMRSRESQWRWWNDNDPTQLQRPQFTAVLVKPTDEFEAARPEVGAVLRVRCQWAATHMAVLLRPVVELTALCCDGAQLSPRVFEQRNNRDQIVDHYYAVELPQLQPGNHIVEVELRNVSDGNIRCYVQELGF